MERENLHCVRAGDFEAGMTGEATSGDNREGDSTDAQ